MRTVITEQRVTSNADGVPIGMQVTLSTFEDDGTFIANELLGFYAMSTSQVDALNTANSQLSAANDALTADKIALQSQVDTLTETVTTLNESVIDLQTQVSDLVQYRPFDPNVIRSEAFYRRITGDELFKLGVLASTDETAKGILLLLNQYLTEEWQVILDDPQVVGAMQYLSAVLPLNEGRVNEILRPGNSDEAFVDA